ncbi:hypothetical protein OG322_26660 [Streptomyces sp. NBC_01260]|uniref:hypothetical protein n=1 Tax=Streptomyces sp. NBC_01260 TaxID=2903801 RepID=UPI002E318A8E|nr:hypothetical protein [Streptomyces sp. NBC_01260]
MALLPPLTWAMSYFVAGVLGDYPRGPWAGLLRLALAAAVFGGVRSSRHGRHSARAALRTATDQREAQRLAAEPAQRTVDLAILRETAERVDRESGEIRTELRGMRALQRAYSWTVDRLISRMERAGIPPEPDDVHELVREHMRTEA